MSEVFRSFPWFSYANIAYHYYAGIMRSQVLCCKRGDTMLSLDMCLPASADAVSLAHVEKLLKHEYGIYGQSLDEMKRAQAEKEQMLYSINAGMNELNSAFALLKKSKLTGEQSEHLEQRLDYMALHTAGLIGYITNARRSASGRNFSLEFVDQFLDALTRMHNKMVEFKVYVMEDRASADKSTNGPFASLDDMFASLDS